MASDDETAAHLNPTGAAIRRRRCQPSPSPPASNTDRLIQFRRQKSPSPTESLGSRRPSPTPPTFRGAESLRIVPGGSPTPLEALLVIPAPPSHRRKAVTSVPGPCSTPSDGTFNLGTLLRQPGSHVASGGLPQSSAPTSASPRRHDLAAAAPRSTAQPPALTASELGLADVVMCYQSVILAIFAVVVVYYEQDPPVVMVSEIAGILCLYFHFWSSHITQFWLLRPYSEDSSVIVLLCCFTLCMLAFLVGVNVSPLAGMCITCFASVCMFASLAECIREFRSRRSIEFEEPLGSDLHGGEPTVGGCILYETLSSREQASVHVEKMKTPTYSRKSTASAKPAWK